MHQPGFVYLLEGNIEGIISCTHHPFKLKISAFQQNQLQGIWSSFARSTKPKPETAQNWVQSNAGQKVSLFGQPIKL